MKTPHIVVVGSANIDLTTFTNEIPRPGETIFGREFHLGFGGKGANQAVAARLCGASVSMVARVGDDLFGEATLRNFASYRIDTSHVMVTPGVSSGVAPIFVDSRGQNRILVIKGANDRLVPADVNGARELIAGADMLVLQLEIPLETVYHCLRAARAVGIPTILNPAPAQPIDLSEANQADYLIPNETEAGALSGIEVSDVKSAKECTDLLMSRGLRRVIVTLGENGALFNKDHYPGFPVQAVDTSGAGDAFIGSLACCLGEGMKESEAIPRANLYAALSTMGVGTQTSFVNRERFEAEWNRLARG